MKKIVFLVASLWCLSGCVGAIIGTTATVGVAAFQERSIGSATDDALITVQISEKWFQHNIDLFQALDLTVNEGRVLITGILPSPEMRIDAVRIAWQVKGVEQVINEVQISEKGKGIKGYAKDLWITTKLRAVLTLDRNIATINYTIDTVNGVVYLMGIAQDQKELDRVLYKARDISGVQHVVSYVRLK